MVLTVNVRDDLLTGRPGRALASQDRLHPTSVVPVGADDPVSEVTLGGRDIHAVMFRDVPERAGGGGVRE